jgi:hypothetical protein
MIIMSLGTFLVAEWQLGFKGKWLGHDLDVWSSVLIGVVKQKINHDVFLDLIVELPYYRPEDTGTMYTPSS